MRGIFLNTFSAYIIVNNKDLCFNISYVTVTFSDNWFATTIVASYVYNNYGRSIRLISFIDNLNENGYLEDHYNYLIL